MTEDDTLESTSTQFLNTHHYTYKHKHTYTNKHTHIQAYIETQTHIHTNTHKHMLFSRLLSQRKEEPYLLHYFWNDITHLPICHSQLLEAFCHHSSYSQPCSPLAICCPCIETLNYFCSPLSQEYISLQKSTWLILPFQEVSAKCPCAWKIFPGHLLGNYILFLYLLLALGIGQFLLLQ